MPDYAALQGRVSGLVTKFGGLTPQVVTYRRVMIDETDPLTPVKTTEDIQVDAVFLTPKRDGRESLSEGKTEQRKGYKRMLMGVQEFTPTGQDRVLVAGEDLRICNIKETNPAGQLLLYELELDR